MNFEQSLEQKQRLSLEQLIKMEQIFKDPEDVPMAEKGFDGILKADAILREKRSMGILIGSLADSLLKLIKATNEHNDAEEENILKNFTKHKDVDVLVCNAHIKIPENLKEELGMDSINIRGLKKEPTFDRFEGGIDWWIYNDNDPLMAKNGHNVGLLFNIIPLLLHEAKEAKPGLYIPYPKLVIDTKIHQIKTKSENDGSKISKDVLDEYGNYWEKQFPNNGDYCITKYNGRTNYEAEVFNIHGRHIFQEK